MSGERFETYSFSTPIGWIISQAHNPAQSGFESPNSLPDCLLFLPHYVRLRAVSGRNRGQSSWAWRISYLWLYHFDASRAHQKVTKVTVPPALFASNKKLTTTSQFLYKLRTQIKWYGRCESSSSNHWCQRSIASLHELLKNNL